MEHQIEPAEVVRKQLEAYNAKDIDAFMSFWAEDAQFFAFPSELLAEGAEQIRKRHVARFKEPNLFGHLISRMSVGNLVVDREVVTRTFPEGPGRVDVIAIYEVDGGTISKAWFKVGPPVLDTASSR
ncbi:nuclear transport factor 2 family protein [Microvirga sp. BT688]|uniref:nuclear transport factor 2 family protein n=1 Tax=Microvirga sp. TaxID=1873136 RepID=UPI00168A3931|nr:nuclear transport factor 2 family protein [Microvirga sp.]MBD2748314.1 nuclear transport factor 2 family protein [Microvirga sp.]